MVKKNNTTITLLVGLIILIGVLAFLGGRFDITNQTSTLSVISVFKPNIVSNDQDLSNFNWKIVAVAEGGSEKIVLNMQPQDFKDETGTASEKPFKIFSDPLVERFNYDIKVDEFFEVNNYLVTPIRTVNGNTFSCPFNSIGSLGATRVTFTGLKTDYFCVLEDLDGRTGDVNLQSTEFEVEITVSNGEKASRQVMNSVDTTSVNFDIGGERVANARFVGALVTGNREPTVPSKAFLSSGGLGFSRWTFLDEDLFTAYKNAQEDFRRDVLKDTDITGIQRTSRLDEIHRQLTGQWEDLQVKKERLFIQGEQTLGDDVLLRNPTSESTARIEAESNILTLKPTIEFLVNAEWIGVEKLVGKPDILDLDTSEFSKLDSSGEIRIQVKNTGESSRFITTLSGCSFRPRFNDNSFNIGAGETKSYSLFIQTGNLNKDVSESCTVKVSDSNQPDNFDTDTITVNFKAVNTCDPGIFSCDVNRNAVVQCNSEGTEKVVVEQCSDSQLCQFTDEGNTGGFQCVNKDIIAPPPPPDDLNKVALTIVGILSLFVSGFTFFKLPIKNNGTKLIVSLLIGVVSFFLIALLVKSVAVSIQNLFSFNVLK